MALISVAIAQINDPSIIHNFILLRMLRLLRLLVAVPQLRLVLRTLLSIAPDAANYLLLLATGMFCFNLLGVEFFGGKISLSPESHYYKVLEGSDYMQSKYWTHNFNDFPSGMLTLFALVIVNNWFVFVEAFVLVTSPCFYLFFIINYVICCLMILNVVVAVVLDSFLGEWKQQRGLEPTLEVSLCVPNAGGDEQEGQVQDDSYLKGERQCLNAVFTCITIWHTPCFPVPQC